jgi:hypothetical protein
MSVIIIEKKAISLVCHRCSWKWNYTGKNPYVATCPFCRTNISIRKYKRLLLLKESKKVEKPLQIGLSLDGPDQFVGDTRTTLESDSSHGK